MNAVDPQSPIRVCVCISQFHPTVGGAEGQLLDLARRWALWGHPPTVITRRIAGVPQTENYDGVRIQRIIDPVELGPLFGVTFVAQMASALVRWSGNFDVILAGQGPWEAVATGLAAIRIGKPTAVRVANTGPFGDLAQLRRAKGSWLLAPIVRRNTSFVALSNEALAELADLKVQSSQWVRIDNGVDHHRFRPVDANDAERERTVLFVGRLTPQKDPFTLLQAWRLVRGRVNARLQIAGKGPMEDELRQYVASQRLADVEFLGQVGDMSACYSNASLFVLPSRSEGSSNALLEAMACGLCPIATRIGGNVDVIEEGETGLLVPPGNADALAQAIEKVLADHVARRRIGNAARARVVRHHDPDRCAQDYLDHFRSLLGRREGPNEMGFRSPRP